MKIRSSNYPAIAVVGHLVKDEIHTLDGNIRSGLGGSAYNLAALAAVQKTGKIYPVCRIGKDINKLSAELFGISPLFDLSGISRTKRPNVVNRLVYNPEGSREEWNSRKQSPLALNPPLLNFDALLLNFISGSDVRLGDLLPFRKKFRGLIYCDFHSLSLGYDLDKHRYQRYHPRWRDYLSAADIIQMNIWELATLSRRALNDRRAVFQACSRLHEAGPDIAIVTAGHEGAMMSLRRQRHFYHLPAISIGKEVDATGCGDTLASAFLYTYLSTEDPIKALEIGNRYAAAKVTFSGIAGFKGIDQILSTMQPPIKSERIF